MRLLLTLAVLAATPRAADACVAATPFDLFDRADRVIVGTVVTSEAKRRPTATRSRPR